MSDSMPNSMPKDSDHHTPASATAPATTAPVAQVSATPAAEPGAQSTSQTLQHFGRPVLVCRWRLFAQSLPLENRHLRALSRRCVQGSQVDTRLVAWAQQHIEWTLFTGAVDHPHGVLMLIIDEEGQAAMTVGEFSPLENPSLELLCARAQTAATEAAHTGVAPESMWTFFDGVLYWGAGEFESPSGANSLVLDLAKTLGIAVVRKPGLLQEIQDGASDFTELCLVSDEHGIVCDRAHAGSMTTRLCEYYKRLLAAEEKKTRTQNKHA